MNAQLNAQITLIDILKTHQDLIIQRWADDILKAPWADTGIDKDWLIQERLNPLFPLLIELLEKQDDLNLESQIRDFIKQRIEATTTLRELFSALGILCEITNKVISLYPSDSQELNELYSLWADIIRVFVWIIMKTGEAHFIPHLKSNEFQIAAIRTIRQSSYIKKIEKLAFIDELTGLFNRRKFNEVINKEVERAMRYNRQLSLLMLDIDHFKNYNDNNGHLKGDWLLAEIGHLILIQLRSSDYGFRYGGEEFAILLTETNKEGGSIVAERIRKSIEASVFDGSEKQPLGRVTVSIGAASCPEDSDSVLSLINTADMALYEAKNSGKNRVCLAQKALKKSG